MAKTKTVYSCEECGYQSSRWLGKCPECGSWNSFGEAVAVAAKPAGVSHLGQNVPKQLSEIVHTNDERIKTGSDELDRVLSGGIVKGSLVLISGDPGIGKSTLLLQICQRIGEQGFKVLYVSGEESAAQIKMRAERLGIQTEQLYILSETNIEAIHKAVVDLNPQLMIIDSIQTMYTESAVQAPGTVTQVRESTTGLMRLGKSREMAVVIVGHATKDGSIAGPRILEHMVDSVLYLEGERYLSYRILRAVKNRFGSTNEIGVFEMGDKGLRDILNPSEYLLSGRPQDAPGSVVTAVIEGTRAIITEVQALVSATSFTMPRRTTSGFDLNRAFLIIAILEKKLGLKLGQADIYVNMAGGLRIAEPALDCAVAAAIFSSYRNIAPRHKIAVFGELGLAGEVRAVSFAEKRILEAAKMGFKTCVIPKDNYTSVEKTKVLQKSGCKAVGVMNITELADILF